jgi:hypothetical protein
MALVLVLWGCTKTMTISFESSTGATEMGERVEQIRRIVESIVVSSRLTPIPDEDLRRLQDLIRGDDFGYDVVADYVSTIGAERVEVVLLVERQTNHPFVLVHDKGAPFKRGFATSLAEKLADSLAVAVPVGIRVQLNDKTHLSMH